MENHQREVRRFSRRTQRNLPPVNNISDTEEMTTDSEDDNEEIFYGSRVARSPITSTNTNLDQDNEVVEIPDRVAPGRRRILLESTDEDDNIDTTGFTSEEDEGRLDSEEFQSSSNLDSGSSDSDLTIISPGPVYSSTSDESTDSFYFNGNLDNDSVLSINIPHLETSVRLSSDSNESVNDSNTANYDSRQATVSVSETSPQSIESTSLLSSVNFSNLLTADCNTKAIPTSFLAASTSSVGLANSPNEKINRKHDQSLSDDEGQICPICFEPWSNSGEHRLSSLKCGHIFGKTCIEKWLRASTAKCPQCNSKANKKDIRIIYAKSLKAVDTSEKDRLAKELEEIKKKCAMLERENAKIVLKNELESQKLKKSQEELKMLQNSVCDHPLPSMNGSSGSLSSKKKLKLTFFMSFDMTKEGACRVMVYNEWMNMLVVSVPSQVTMFAGYGVKKINILDLKCDKYIPLHQKHIRDLAFNPERHDLLLSVAMDKCVKIMNVTSNIIVNTYAVAQPLWSCCWNADNSSEFFAGSATGTVYHFDIKNTTEPIKSYTLKGSGPIVSLSYIPSKQDAEFYHSGLLVTRLNTISFVELLNEGIKEHDLPLEGPFVYTDFDLKSRHIFVTCRPTPRYAHARHIVCQLHSYNNSQDATTISASEIQSFKGGTTMKVLSRACLMANPHADNETLALFSEESSLTTKIFDLHSASLVQMLRTNSNVIDIIPISNMSNNYVALLTEKKVILYKWIEKF